MELVCNNCIQVQNAPKRTI